MTKYNTPRLPPGWPPRPYNIIRWAWALNVVVTLTFAAWFFSWHLWIPAAAFVSWFLLAVLAYKIKRRTAWEAYFHDERRRLDEEL